MNHILTERLRLTVPDLGNLEGHKFVLETMLRDSRPPTDSQRSSALTDYGNGRRRYLPNSISLRESGEYLGAVMMTMNLDAFTMDRVDGKTRIRPDKPLEVGIRTQIEYRHRGNGYGVEAARAFCDYVMRVLGAVRVVSEARRADPQAIKLMDQLGMRLHPHPRPEYPHRIIGVLEAGINSSACA
jgi:RimJ/RimL family protein N-acetyltransferase